MVIIFLFFGYQKWWAYEAQRLIPYISNGPLLFWLYPVFGVRGASWFLGSCEDPDVVDEVHQILRGEGIQFLLQAQTLNVQGRSGEGVSLTVRTPSGEQKIEGSDILAAAGRVPNTARDRA
jgi:NADPH-dependent 2,4-dienoyl-CoA reductase/sulfur reductase-like enzyme